MLTLIVVIVGLVILIKSQTGEDEPTAMETSPPEVALEDVLPPSRSVARPAETASVEPEPVIEEPVEAAPEPIQDAVADDIVQEAQETEPSPAAQAQPKDPADKTSLEAQQLIEEALTLRDEGKIIAARDKLNQALNMQLSPQIRTGVMNQLAALSETWLFSRNVIEGDTLTGYHLVRPGQLLSRIGRDHNVPYEILMRINGIDRPERLQAGRQIKIVHGPFHAVVNRTALTLDLYLQDMYVKTYQVGLGRPEHTTPAGRWVVAPGGKMIKPTWTDPDTGRTYKGDDPDYPLGSRWIALDGIEGDARGRTGFALHGTHEPETIGTLSSRGCIRLHNGDVIEVYEMLEPGQSNVHVTD